MRSINNAGSYEFQQPQLIVPTLETAPVMAASRRNRIICSRSYMEAESPVGIKTPLESVSLLDHVTTGQHNDHLTFVDSLLLIVEEYVMSY
jgi:hypothetical protein